MMEVNKFPVVFSKENPPLKTRIMQMRYLGTLPPVLTPTIHILEPPTTDQKEVQTSPESTFFKGFFTIPKPKEKSLFPLSSNEEKPSSRTKRPPIKIPSPLPLTSGLFAKLSETQNFSGNPPRLKQEKPTKIVGKAISLKKWARRNEETQGKSGDFDGENKGFRRPESTPPVDIVEKDRDDSKLLKQVLLKGRKLSLATARRTASPLFDPIDVTQVAISAAKSAFPEQENPTFFHFACGKAEIPTKMMSLFAVSQIFGHPVTDLGKKRQILKAISELFSVLETEIRDTKLFHHFESMDFYAVLIGEFVPISPCCKAAIILQFTKHADGQILCSHERCQNRHVSAFKISEEMKVFLWKLTSDDLSEIGSKAVSMQIQTGSYRSRSLRTQARNRREEKREKWLLPAFVNKIRMRKDPKSTSFMNDKFQPIRMRTTLGDFRRDKDSFIRDIRGRRTPLRQNEESRVFSLPEDKTHSQLLI